MADTATIAIADAIHDQMGLNPKALYDVEEMKSLDMRASRVEVALSVINYLLSQGLIKALNQGGRDVFKYVDKDIAEKFVARVLLFYIISDGTPGKPPSPQTNVSSFPTLRIQAQKASGPRR